MSDEYEVRAAEIQPGAILDETGIKIAFVRADSVSGEITLHWLPDLFNHPMPPAVRKAIAEKLRLHADKLESGELEQRMQKFSGINNPGNRSEREQ